MEFYSINYGKYPMNTDKHSTNTFSFEIKMHVRTKIKATYKFM